MKDDSLQARLYLAFFPVTYHTRLIQRLVLPAKMDKKCLTRSDLKKKCAGTTRVGSVDPGERYCELGAALTFVGIFFRELKPFRM